MSRYIDADEALRMMRNSQQDNPCESPYKGIWHTAHESCISCVDAQPTADVVEVRHGEWIDVQRPYTTSLGAEGKSPYRLCSKCKWEYPVVTVGQHLKKYTYCPNCGAKMDGERSENDNH